MAYFLPKKNSAFWAMPITLADIPACCQWQSSSTNYKHTKVLVSSNVSLQVADKSNSMTTMLVFFSANFCAVLLVSYTRSHRFLVVIFLVYESSAAVSAGVHSRLILQHNGDEYLKDKCYEHTLCCRLGFSWCLELTRWRALLDFQQITGTTGFNCRKGKIHAIHLCY